MSKRVSGSTVVIALMTMVFGCSEGEGTSESHKTAVTEAPAVQPPSVRAALESTRYAYFGDLHVHTAYSMDAFQFGTLATPDDAYRYAKGEAIKHPAGFDKIGRASCRERV